MWSRALAAFEALSTADAPEAVCLAAQQICAEEKPSWEVGAGVEAYLWSSHLYNKNIHLYNVVSNKYKYL